MTEPGKGPLRAPRSARRCRAVAAVALLGAAVGCGPEHSVSLGVKNVATDVLLASPTPSPATPPVGPAPPVPLKAPPGFPFVPAPPIAAAGSGRGSTVALPPVASEPAPAPVVSCPTASALTGAAYPAPTLPQGAPAQRAYSVRVDGSYAVKGPHAASGRYAPADFRRIHDVGTTPDGGAWTYQVTDKAGLTTSYAVRPHQAGQDAQQVGSTETSVPSQPGIYVTQFSLKRADGSQLTLAPQPALLVAKLPFAAGDAWISRAVDPSRQVAITLNGQTGLGPRYSPVHDRVDACGTVLDAYWVQYTVNTQPVNPATQGSEPPSEIRGSDLYLQFVGSKVAFAPQFGGIPVEDEYVLSGNDGADAVTIDRHTTYDQAPVIVGSAR